MSLATERAAIAAALSTVTGVNGYPHRPTTPRPGDAWPTLPTLDRQADLIWRRTWTVIVLLPQDERGASTWLDQHFDALVAALQAGPIYPETAEPALINTGAGDMYALEITGRS